MFTRVLTASRWYEQLAYSIRRLGTLQIILFLGKYADIDGLSNTLFSIHFVITMDCITHYVTFDLLFTVKDRTIYTINLAIIHLFYVCVVSAIQQFEGAKPVYQRLQLPDQYCTGD